MVLGVFERLKWVDREDIIADALQNLMAAVRDSKIRGRSNAEIDGYVCRSLRNQALNFLRGHGRRRRAGESTVEDLDGDIELRDTVADGPSPLAGCGKTRHGMPGSGARSNKMRVTLFKQARLMASAR